MRAMFRPATWLRALAVATAIVGMTAGQPQADENDASYQLEVGSVQTKVGQHAVLTAKMWMQDGLRFLPSYNSRVIKLSALEESVKFDHEVVRGRIQDDSLVFNIGLTPTKAGQHPINGIFRVGYARDSDVMRMVSIPLIATVIATE
jgi:hypothetical protein